LQARVIGFEALIADTLYGSDENHHDLLSMEVNRMSPVQRNPPKDNGGE
jgi:hypothetical protein